MHLSTVRAVAFRKWIRFRHLQAHAWPVAGLIALLTGCLTTATVVTRASDDPKSVIQGGRAEKGSLATSPGPSSSSTEPLAPSIYSEAYWAALSDLDLAAMRDAARSESEIGFAEAVALLAAGDHERAEGAFLAISTQPADANVAVASQIMLANTLLYERKWTTLRDLPTSLSLHVDRENTSGLEKWGQAFASIDQELTSFPQKPVSLPLRITSVGTPLVKVRINGKEYEFWLDTGSSMTVLSSDVASDANVLPLSPDTLNVRTFAGLAPVRPAVVKQMEIGSIVIANSPAMVMDASLMRLRTNAEGSPWAALFVDGIIGWDIIRQFDMVMDYENRTVMLQRPANLGTNGTASQNLTWVGKPLVQVRTKLGEILHFTLDTGAQASFVNASTLEKVGASTTMSDTRVFGIAKTGQATHRVVPFLTLDVAGKLLRLERVIAYVPDASSLVKSDGILGSDIAQFGRIRIDATNGLFSVGV